MRASMLGLKSGSIPRKPFCTGTFAKNNVRSCDKCHLFSNTWHLLDDKWQVSDAVSVCLPVEIIPIKGSVAVPTWDCDVPTLGL